MSPTQPTGEELARYLERDQADLLDELNVYAEAAGVTYRGLGDAWQRLLPRLDQAICKDWEWCDRRQDARFDDKLTLAFAVAEVLTATALPWGVPVALVAVISRGNHPKHLGRIANDNRQIE